VLRITTAPRVDGPGRVLSTFQPHVVRRLQFPPGAREAMLAGFAGVTTASGGTATSSFEGFPTNSPVGGKTGTAQVGKDPKTGAERQDNSLFAGFMPVDDPKYTGVTVIEGGGFGSDAAAPVIRNIFEPIANNNLPPVPPGGAFNAQDVLKVQKNLAARGPAD
jgi:penicillin-binding protein 2